MEPDELPRRYAFLVATVEVEALRAAHERALAAAPVEHRRLVLVALRDECLTGERLTPELVSRLARLLVAAERRRVGTVLDSLPTDVRIPLQRNVISALAWDESSYAAWEPPAPPAEEEVPHLGNGWEGIDDNQVIRFTHHSQEVIGGRQAVFTRRRG